MYVEINFILFVFSRSEPLRTIEKEDSQDDRSDTVSLNKEKEQRVFLLMYK